MFGTFCLPELEWRKDDETVNVAADVLSSEDGRHVADCRPLLDGFCQLITDGLSGTRSKLMAFISVYQLISGSFSGTGASHLKVCPLIFQKFLYRKLEASNIPPILVVITLYRTNVHINQASGDRVHFQGHWKCRDFSKGL